MFANCTPVNFSAEYLSYLTGRLSDGKTLANLCLERVNFESATALLTIPSASLKSPLHLNQGGGLPGAIQSEAVLVQAIHDYVIKPDHMVILENQLALKEDPAIQRNKERGDIRFFSDEVYHCLFQGDYDSLEITKFVRTTRFVSSPLGFFSKFPAKDASLELSEGDLYQICSNMTALILGVCDGESYLIISPHRNG